MNFKSERENILKLTVKRKSKQLSASTKKSKRKKDNKESIIDEKIQPQNTCQTCKTAGH